MEQLSRDIKRLENSIARYIYIKYIQEREIANALEKEESSNSSCSDDDEDNDDEDDDDDDEVVEIPTSNAKSKAKSKAKVVRTKVLDKGAYTIYCKNVFYQSRSCFALNQNDLIREDIQIMTLADKAYEEHPDEFKVGNFDLPPNVLRCGFIRKYHHRYYRCKNQIMNKDSDICKKHKNCENIYYDNYNELLESLGL